MAQSHADTEDQCYGILIKQAREQRRLSQENLAELVAVEPRTVQRWETEQSIPWPACVERLVAALPEIATTLVGAILKKILNSSLSQISSSTWQYLF